MTEVSNPSLQAFAHGQYNYEEAVKLYDKEIEENPSNYNAYNNRGLCKIHLGAEPHNIILIEEGMKDFNSAIELAQKDGVAFENAQHNLALAIGMLRF